MSRRGIEMTASTESSQWVGVTRSDPCPICEKPDWCQVTSDGKIVHCHRVESRQRVKSVKSDGWIHRVGDDHAKVREFIPAKKKTHVDWRSRAAGMYRSLEAPQTRETLSRTLNVHVKALERLGVGWGWDDYRGLEFSSWPCFDGEGQEVGIWRRFLDTTVDGKKQMAMAGSTPGLFMTERWLKTPGLTDPIFVVEGGSDVAACESLFLNVLGRPSCRGGVEFLRKILHGINQPIVVIGERDEDRERRGNPKTPQCEFWCHGCSICWPGMDGARSVASQLKDITVAACGWCLLGSKDSRSWWIDHPSANKAAFIDECRQSFVSVKR